MTHFGVPLFDPFWQVRAKSDAFHRCYLGGSGQGAQKGGPKRGHFGPPPRAPDPPKPLKKWTKVRIQLEDLGSEGPLGPPQRAILAPLFDPLFDPSWAKSYILKGLIWHPRSGGGSKMGQIWTPSGHPPERGCQINPFSM